MVGANLPPAESNRLRKNIGFAAGFEKLLYVYFHLPGEDDWTGEKSTIRVRACEHWVIGSLICGQKISEKSSNFRSMSAER